MNASISTTSRPVARKNIPALSVFGFHPADVGLYVAIDKVPHSNNLYRNGEYLSIDEKGVIGWVDGDTMCIVHGTLNLDLGGAE